MSALLHSGAFWALMSAFLWAWAVIFFKRAGESISPPALNLFKGIVALAVFVPAILLTTGVQWPVWSPSTWAWLAFSGIIGISVADTLFFMALNRLGAGLNAVVTCLYFPIITVFAHVFLDEALPLTAVAGGVLVVVGILVGSDVRRASGVDRGQVVSGVALGVTALLSMAAGVVAMKPIIVNEPVLLTTTARLVAGIVPLMVVVWIGPDRAVFRKLIRPSSQWRYALPGAVLGGALSMLAWIAGFAMTEASRAAILNQLSTIFVFVLAAVVLKEPVSSRRVLAITVAFLGGLLVIAGQ